MKNLSGNDELILLAILALKEEAYGATIMKHLTRVSGREWSIGAIYDPLYRMEKAGYVRSEQTAPVNVRGGRSKRLYVVTVNGLNALREQQRVRRELSRALNEFEMEHPTE